MSWDLNLEDPVTLPDGRVIWTLREAAEFVQALPATEVGHERWQAAIEALIMAAEKRGPVMHARIGLLMALNRNKPRGVEGKKADRQRARWAAAKAP